MFKFDSELSSPWFDKHLESVVEAGMVWFRNDFMAEQEAVERDRECSFDPQLLRKRQKRFEWFDEKIIAM
ncbi:MAG: hypothetical protein R3F07_04020 [Opitutaceae bacterium]